MKYRYDLIFKDEEIFLFNSKVQLDFEAEATSFLKGLKDFKVIELKIKFIFSKFESIIFESHFWTDNLETLLAHGFSLRNSTLNKTLVKSFEPLQFFLSPERHDKPVHYGFFHTTVNKTSTEQFIYLCENSGYQGLELHKFLLISICTSGGSIFCLEPSHKITLLFKMNLRTKQIFGEEIFISYLINSTI
jgi:hypothetical protein